MVESWWVSYNQAVTSNQAVTGQDIRGEKVTPYRLAPVQPQLIRDNCNPRLQLLVRQHLPILHVLKGLSASRVVVEAGRPGVLVGVGNDQQSHNFVTREAKEMLRREEALANALDCAEYRQASLSHSKIVTAARDEARKSHAHALKLSRIAEKHALMWQKREEQDTERDIFK
jgi:hypothetical protein